MVIFATPSLLAFSKMFVYNEISFIAKITTEHMQLAIMPGGELVMKISVKNS